MIDVEVKQHSKYAIEFKSGISIPKQQESKDGSEFMINTWFFIPNSLDVNQENYTKNSFYRDIKTHLRLITPIYTLKEILTEQKGPFTRLENAVRALVVDTKDVHLTEKFEYQIKMLLCIVKSAMRRETNLITEYNQPDELNSYTNSLIDKIVEVRAKYRKFKIQLDQHQLEKEQIDFYKFGDEFLGNLVLQYSYWALKILDAKPRNKELQKRIKLLIQNEDAYKEDSGYITLAQHNESRNSLVITQRNVLKKLIESDLFLQIIKKPDGEFVKQFYYGAAAALSMLFATVVTFIATQRYGNFTFDLLVVLVISYVFKDRIKEVMRYYFTYNMSKKHFDTKMKLSIRKQEIGIVKEAVDFINEDKAPQEIVQLRHKSPLVEAETKIFGEQIIVYRKLVKLSHKKLETYKEYQLSGINDISRFELSSLTHKMDNTNIPLFQINDHLDVECFEGSRVYPIHICIKCISAEREYIKGYRVLLNRDGITEIKELGVKLD